MSEKTEQATPKRITDARKKGEVAKTTEAASYLQVIVVLGFFLSRGNELVSDTADLVRHAINLVINPATGNLSSIADEVITLIVSFSLPLAGILILATVLANFLQTGPLIATEALKFDPQKLNPVENVKNLFSMDKLVELAKAVAILVTLLFLMTGIIRRSLISLQRLPYCGVRCAPSFLVVLMHELIVTLIVFGVILSAIDFGYKKYRHAENMKMSKEDVKQENKDQEGDPEVKQHRRKFHRELQSGDLANTVQRSTAVVRNPTHIAVCLYYKQGETPVPRVLTKGMDLVARQIVDIATQAGVPVVEDVLLARALFHVRNGQTIPRKLFVPVALLLAALQKLENEADGGGSSTGTTKAGPPHDAESSHPPTPSDS